MNDPIDNAKENEEEKVIEIYWKVQRTSWVDGLIRNLAWGLVVVAVWLLILILLTWVSPYR